MDETTTEELLVAILARVTSLEAIVRTFAAIWLRNVLPSANKDTFRDEPLVKAFAKMSAESIESFAASLGEQFPDLEKVICEHLELSMGDLIKNIGGDKRDA